MTKWSESRLKGLRSLQLIDDYIHFINYHSFELEIIYNQLINTQMFTLCKINACKYTSRHHMHRQIVETNKNILAPTLNFHNESKSVVIICGNNLKSVVII